jgi:hypothetical protein
VFIGAQITRFGRLILSDQPNSPQTEKPQQKKREGNYPVSESFQVLEGYDIYRSEKLIVALVVVQSDFGRDLRLYRWQKRNDAWKVDLCRMSVALWNWETLAQRAKELIEKYEIGKRNRQKVAQDE